MQEVNKFKYVGVMISVDGGGNVIQAQEVDHP